MRTKIFFVTFLFLMFPLLSGFALYHRYGPFMGKVIDAETKEPIEGAAVLAVYYTVSSGPGGQGDNYTNAQEVLTDTNGEFYIPPLDNFTFRPFQYHASYVGFTFFKPGYGAIVPYRMHNGVLIDGERPKNSFLPQEKHILIELPKLKAREEIRLNIPPIESEAPYSKQINLIRLINEERKRLGFEPAYIK